MKSSPYWSHFDDKKPINNFEAHLLRVCELIFFCVRKVFGFIKLNKKETGMHAIRY